MLVQAAGHGSDLVVGGLVVEGLRTYGEGNAADADPAELGVAKAELAGGGDGVGVPGERQVEEMAVEGDGAAVAHVPEGGVDGNEGFEDDEHNDRERGQSAPDFEDEKNETATFRMGLVRQIDECSLMSDYIARSVRMWIRV